MKHPNLLGLKTKLREISSMFHLVQPVHTLKFIQPFNQHDTDSRRSFWDRDVEQSLGLEARRQCRGLARWSEGGEWDWATQDKKGTCRLSMSMRWLTNLQRDRRVGPVLSQQVRALIGEGNQAYVDNNVPEAIRIMQEVIRIEPRAVSAWSVLAQCQADDNEPVKALQLRIMAAHLTHDPDEWYNLASQSRLVALPRFRFSQIHIHI